MRYDLVPYISLVLAALPARVIHVAMDNPPTAADSLRSYAGGGLVQEAEEKGNSGGELRASILIRRYPSASSFQCARSFDRGYDGGRFHGVVLGPDRWDAHYHGYTGHAAFSRGEKENVVAWGFRRRASADVAFRDHAAQAQRPSRPLQQEMPRHPTTSCRGAGATTDPWRQPATDVAPALGGPLPRQRALAGLPQLLDPSEVGMLDRRGG